LFILFICFLFVPFLTLEIILRPCVHPCRCSCSYFLVFGASVYAQLHALNILNCFFRLIRESSRQRKRRQQLKDGIEKLCENNSDAAGVLKSFNRNQVGRPRTEVDQPELLSTIVKLVQNSTAADDRRRTECLRSVSTLDALHSELSKLGYSLSRSALYLRLMPRRGNTSEGKRHVSTVPVKLLRPENSLRKKNIDRMFAKSFCDDMFEVCKLFGPKAVLFMSNDDKARIPLGLAAANLQARCLCICNTR